MDDLELLRCYARACDGEALRVLIERHQQRVFAICLRHLKSEADARDATQEVFLSLMLSADEVRSNVHGWLYRCARNTCTSMIRLRRVRQRYEAEKARINPEGKPEAGGVPQEHAEILDACLRRLDSVDRNMVIRNHVMGSTQKEIASSLGVSQQAVAKRINKALSELRREVMRQGIVLSAGAAILLVRRAAACTARGLYYLASTVATSGSGTAATIKVAGTAGALLVAVAAYEKASRSGWPAGSSRTASGGAAGSVFSLSIGLRGGGAGGAGNFAMEGASRGTADVQRLFSALPAAPETSDQPESERPIVLPITRPADGPAMVLQDRAKPREPVGKDSAAEATGMWDEPEAVIYDAPRTGKTATQALRRGAGVVEIWPANPGRVPGSLAPSGLAEKIPMLPRPVLREPLEEMALDLPMITRPTTPAAGQAGGPPVTVAALFSDDEHGWPKIVMMGDLGPAVAPEMGPAAMGNAGPAAIAAPARTEAPAAMTGALAMAGLAIERSNLPGDMDVPAAAFFVRPAMLVADHPPADRPPLEQPVKGLMLAEDSSDGVVSGMGDGALSGMGDGGTYFGGHVEPFMTATDGELVAGAGWPATEGVPEPGSAALLCLPAVLALLAPRRGKGCR